MNLDNMDRAFVIVIIRNNLPIDLRVESISSCNRKWKRN
jgi:hypothetical protein